MGCACRYCILGDGCNMEGISNEAASLAGHWGLGKLICLYDDNHISIDGDTEIAFTESVDARFDALGWHTIWVKNGNTGYDEIRAAIEEAKSVTDRPTMIKVNIQPCPSRWFMFCGACTSKWVSQMLRRCVISTNPATCYMLKLSGEFGTGRVGDIDIVDVDGTGDNYHWIRVTKQGELVFCSRSGVGRQGGGCHTSKPRVAI